MEFSRQEYWRGLPFPSPGHPPDPGMESKSRAFPALAGEIFTTVPPGKPSLAWIVLFFFFLRSGEGQGLEHNYPWTVEHSKMLAEDTFEVTNPTPTFYTGGSGLRQAQGRASCHPTLWCRIHSTLSWRPSTEMFIHQMWAKEDHVAALPIQICVCGP